MGSSVLDFAPLEDMMITLTIDMSRELVKEAGYRIQDDRWPFTYHHDHIRQAVPWSINPDGNQLSRAEIGMALIKWAKGTKGSSGAGAEAYTWELIDGALKYLFEHQPEGNRGKLAGLENEARAVLWQHQSRVIDEVRRQVVDARMLTPQ